MKKRENVIVPYQNPTIYRKSNFLISAKYKSSLLENQLLALSLTRVKEGERGELYSEITAQEIRTRLKKESGSFYDQLYNCAECLTNRQIIMEDKDDHQFCILNIVQTAKYGDGIFKIKFNYDLKKYLVNLQQNFTNLSIETLMNFKSVYAFRLYELLKSKSYYPKGMNKSENIFRVSYGLAELKLDLGAVNSSYDRVQRILRGSNPDYDKAVEVANEKTFDRWSNFKARVLDVALSEINNSQDADMKVSYETGKAGKGGKVCEVHFTVTLLPKKSEEEQSVQKKEVELNILDSAEELLRSEKVTYSDLKAICTEAENDIERIKKAYRVYKSQNQEHSNFTGWMIMAIRKGYEGGEELSINKMMTRDYDFAELEKEIIAN